jgi:hypothetical protein
MPDTERQTDEEASVDHANGTKKSFTRQEVATKLGLTGAAVAHRELRAGVVPHRDEHGKITYTAAQVEAMEHVVVTREPGKKIVMGDGEVEVARAVFQAFQDGKDSAEVVLMGLATPKQAASLAEQWAKMPPKLSRGGLGLSQDAVTKLAAMLGAEVVIKTEEDLVGAVAALVSRSKQNGVARAAPLKVSNAIPKAWSQSSAQEASVEPPAEASVGG